MGMNIFGGKKVATCLLGRMIHTLSGKYRPAQSVPCRKIRPKISEIEVNYQDGNEKQMAQENVLTAE